MSGCRSRRYRSARLPLVADINGKWSTATVNRLWEPLSAPYGAACGEWLVNGQFTLMDAL